MASVKGQFKKGHIPANKKAAAFIVCKQCKKEFGVQPYREKTAAFCSPSCRATLNNQKEKHPNWKGGINYNVKYREDVIKKLGVRCKKCGFDDIRALQIDHVNNDGFKERGAEKGVGNPYKIILGKIGEGSKNYQVLCANCNWIKRLEYIENNKKSVWAK